MMGKYGSASTEQGSGVLWGLLVLAAGALLGGALFQFAAREQVAADCFYQSTRLRLAAESGIEAAVYRLGAEPGLWERAVSTTVAFCIWPVGSAAGASTAGECKVYAIGQRGEVCLLARCHTEKWPGRALARVQRSTTGKMTIHWGR